jgi:hypothetical protein
MKTSLIKILVVVCLSLCVVPQLYSQCISCPLTGLAQLTVGQNNTYSVTPVSGASYFWSVTGTLSIIGSSTGSSVTVNGTTGSGSVCVVRYISGAQPCASCIAVTVGSGSTCQSWAGNFGSFNMITGANNTVCPDERFAVSMVSDIPADHYVTWSISPSISPSFGSLTNHRATYLEFTDNGSSQYVVTQSYFCLNGASSGPSQTRTITKNSVHCNFIPARVASEETNVYPNPVSNELTLQLPISKTEYQVNITNSAGEGKHRSTTLGGAYNIDVSGIEKGIYHITISNGKKIVKHAQFIKE